MKITVVDRVQDVQLVQLARIHNRLARLTRVAQPFMIRSKERASQNLETAIRIDPQSVTMRRCLSTAFVLVLLSGCAADVEFTPYSGGQQNWPVATGSFVQRNFGLPVFVNGPPDQAYRVIGYIQVENAPGGRRAKSQSIKAVVSEAIKHGADAVILLESGTDVAGVYNTGSAFGNAYSSGTTAFGSASGFGFSVPIRKGHARAIAIKFVSS